MVKSFFNVLHKEITGLHQAAYLLAFFALCSQVLALVRDRILAANFGASGTLDLYYSAFRIPDFLFATVASVVSISVLIPFIIERLDKGESEAKEFLDSIFSFFFVFMLSVGVVAFVTAPYVLRFLFPSLTVSPDDFSSLLKLTRILLLSPIFLGFSNLLASITQIHKRFFIYALSPVLYNIGIIFGVVALYPVMGLSGLGWGVALGAFFHFAIQVPFIVSRRLFPRLKFPINFSAIKRVVATSLPRTLTVSANELAELFLISFASFLVPGSISVFNFSFNLQSVPFSIIGISYSLAAFPTLTRFFSSGSLEKFVDQMVTSSRHIIFWSVPVSVLFVVLRAQIVRTLLGAGRFNWDDTRLVAAALALFTVSLVAQNLVTLFVRAFYSRGETRTPLIMNLISAGVIIGSSYFLARIFDSNFFFRSFMESILKVSDIPGTVVLMLPFSYTIGVLLSLVIHWVGFAREFPTYSRPVFRTLFEVTSASVIMGYVAYVGLKIFDDFFDLSTLLGIFSQGLFAGLLGIVSGICVLYILQSRELAEVWATLHKKIWKAKVVGPDASME